MNTRAFLRPISFRLAVLLLLAAGVVAATLKDVAAGRPNPSPLSKDLVKNAGAEDGAGSDDGSPVAVPNWTLTGGFTAVQYGTEGFPDAAASTDIDGGANFFAGGDTGDSSRAIQEIDVSQWSDLIDRNKLKVRLSAWQAGFDDQGDNGQVIVQFVSEAGKLLGSVKLGAVAGTNEVFGKHVRAKDLPARTRTLRVILVARRVAGNYTDAYFDNLIVKLVRKRVVG